jgi:hypothetical protein
LIEPIKVVAEGTFFLVTKATVEAWKVSFCRPAMETVAKSLRWNVKLTRSSRYIRSLVVLNGAQGYCNSFLNVFIRIGHGVLIKYKIKS